MLAGSVSIGFVVSTTVTENAPDAGLPCASIAVHATVVVPSANVDPEAGVQLTGTGPSMLSSADSPGSRSKDPTGTCVPSSSTF
jgi:hypothetical protein